MVTPLVSGPAALSVKVTLLRTVVVMPVKSVTVWPPGVVSVAVMGTPTGLLTLSVRLKSLTRPLLAAGTVTSDVLA